MIHIQNATLLPPPLPLQPDGSPLVITIAFCFPQNNEQHEHYIHSLIQACSALKIHCKSVSVHSTNIEHIIQRIEDVPLTLIICLDNAFAQAMLIARSKLHLSAPLIMIDLELPKTIPLPLPPKCVALSTPLDELAFQLCQPLRLMPSLKHIGIMYDEHDATLCALLPDIESLLKNYGYTLSISPRKPTLTSADVATIADYDLLIFLCRNAPAHFIQRLALVCKAHQTLLYTANPTAIAYGAICSFGINTTLVIQETIDILTRYITTNTSSGNRIIEYQFTINQYELAQYGEHHAELTPFITLVKETTVISPTTADKVSAYLRLEQIPLE